MKRLLGGWTLACAAAVLAGCVSLGGSSGAVKSTPPKPQAVTALAPPVLDLPPSPKGRSEDELLAAAHRRAKRIESLVEADIASAVAPPMPQPVVPAAPVAKKASRASTKAPAKAAEKAPERAAEKVPAPVPAPPAVPSTPTPAKVVSTLPTDRVAVPTLHVAQRYTTENGLPSNRITAVYVDAQDAWVGTADAGVARLNFAEGNWIVTKAEDGLAANRVTDIVKFHGEIYVGTQGGISIWDGVSWRTVAKQGKVKLVNTRFHLNDGLLWVAARTMHGGLLTFDGEKWKDKSTIKKGTVLNNVSDFGFAGKGIWIGTTNRGVLAFDGRSWNTFSVADGLASNFIYTMTVTDHATYLGGCCGVSVYENGAWRIYDIAEGLPHSTVNAIAQDGQLVWFGSKKGLGLFDGFEFTNFYTDDGLTDDRITALFVRGDDEVWVGTADGLNRLEKSY